MIDISNLIHGHSQKDAVDGLYYAARFVKQASHLTEFEKDVFEDDYRSVPSENAKALCRVLIEAYEADVGEPAANFDDETAARVLSELSSAEQNLSIEFTEAEEAAADSAILEICTPELSTRKDIVP